MSDPAAVLDRVTFSYSGGIPALSAVSLEVPRLDYLAVIGPNGGGKTTLLKLLLGLLQPCSGTVRVLGGSPESARSRVGYVPQVTSVDKDFPASVLDVVLMGRLGRDRLLRPHPPSSREEAEQKLAGLDMAHLARKPLGSLSGGQRQRVLIARALMGGPELILLDEPVASVDQASQHIFYSLMEKLNETCTIVFVTHDIGALAGQVKTVACLNVELVSHGADLSTDAVAAAWSCHVDLISHGTPHRVLRSHGHGEEP
jgi:zinc transport system ATP-binding protein